jgi:hypothetical protein
MKHSTRAALVAVLIATLPFGCIADFEPEIGAVRAGICKPEDTDPEQEVSFMQDLKPMFERPRGQPGCGCHLPTSARPVGIDLAGFDMSTYALVMRGGNESGEQIVVPGDPCSSILVQKVSSAPPFGSRMPSSGPPYWSPKDRDLLSDWIAEGARDN